jgi:hypothetical protein
MTEISNTLLVLLSLFIIGQLSFFTMAMRLFFTTRTTLNIHFITMELKRQLELVQSTSVEAGILATQSQERYRYPRIFVFRPIRLDLPAGYNHVILHQPTAKEMLKAKRRPFTQSSS